MAAITLERLTKVYPAGGVTALDALDLHVADGEFVVLVGPSGCGKTTALRLVAGLATVTSGTVRFGDRVVNDISPRHRDVAMVFQNYALYPHLSVAENIGFALANKKVPRAERDRRVRAAAEVLGLSDLLNRKPAQLSGGQRQRVAMGRAIVRGPSVFLMDEPLSNLDAKLRVQMRAEVLRVHREIGAATLYVTHDQVEAMTMGDRVALLDGGVLQQYGTPHELYERPANLFVAAFIGSPEMNLYEASLDASGALILGSQRLGLGPAQPLPGPGPEPGAGPGAEPGGPPAGLAAHAGRKVIVGVRPEDLALGAPGAAVTLSADVRAVQRLGTELHAFFSVDAPAAGTGAVPATLAGTAREPGETGDGPIGQAWNGVARLEVRSGVRAGSRVTFGVDTGRLHFFDPDTGLAIT